MHQHLLLLSQEYVYRAAEEIKVAAKLVLQEVAVLCYYRFLDRYRSLVS